MDRLRGHRPHRGGQPGDLDLDASADALLGAHAAGRPPALDELVTREWRRPQLALCLVIDVELLRPLRDERPPERVVDEVLRLRGHGATALAAALREAADQLARSRAARRVTVLLSDCQATDGQDPVPAARAAEDLVVLAPADDSTGVAELVRRAGGRGAPVSSAADVPAVLADLLG